jgi:hypothetical protein
MTNSDQSKSFITSFSEVLSDFFFSKTQIEQVPNNHQDAVFKWKTLIRDSGRSIEQIQILLDMGFTDEAKIFKVLFCCKGDVSHLQIIY